MKKFVCNCSVCHGVEEKDSKKRLAFIIANHIVRFLPDDLEPGDALKIDCKITSFLRD